MNESCRGYIDTALATFVSGWAADLSEIGKPVDVEIYADGRLLAVTTADLYRRDLAHAGIGNGYHAFEARLPLLEDRRPTTELSACIRGKDYHLRCGSEDSFSIPVDSRVFLRHIATDLVNNCNLRCPFCVVDYSGVKSTDLMTEETFLRMVTLIDSVPEQGFWLSCLHEPTLHPQLGRFLHLIPEASRKKVFFTTNLARRLKESELQLWAGSGIHHVNISMDTMDDDLFAVLRKNGRYAVFHENLETLARVFRQVPDPPKLRFITMAFQSNLHEIPRIVTETHEKYLSSENEIRYTYNVEHIQDEFRRTHYLRKDQWPGLEESLAKLPYRYTICAPPENGYEETIQPSANFFDMDRESGMEPPGLDLPLALRGRYDGSLLVIDHERRYRVNVNTEPDPVGYFRSLSAASQAGSGAAPASPGANRAAPGEASVRP